MIRYDVLIYAGCFVFTAGLFVILGYIFGRKTITDTPLIEKRFDPKDGKEPEMDEITRCLGEDEEKG